MNTKSPLLDLLVCPHCQKGTLNYQEPVMYCPSCWCWYPIENGLLELLEPSLAYTKDRQRFWQKYQDQLSRLNFKPQNLQVSSNRTHLEQRQKEYFDQFAKKSGQTYSGYEDQPFWQAVDEITFTSWRQNIKPGSWLLDIGCAQGRSIKHLVHLPINIVAFDISKEMVKQALKRYQKTRAKLYFFVGNAASKLPFADKTFDYVLVYGVLHHLPNPKLTCREIARILKTSGLYFGSENNASILRLFFNVLQQLFPLWEERAGKEPTFSARTLKNYFKNTSLGITTKTSVFLPPHLINLCGLTFAKWLLSTVDKIFGSLSLTSQSGGLLLLEGQKRS